MTGPQPGPQPDPRPDQRQGQPQQEQPPRAPRHAAVPIDFTAALAAMQDQIDDLIATVTLLQERLERLDPSEHGTQSDGR